MATTISYADGDVFYVVESEANRQAGLEYTFDEYTGLIVSWYNREFIFRFVEIHPVTTVDGQRRHVRFPEEQHGDVWYEACVWVQDGEGEPLDKGGERTRRYKRIHTFDLGDELPTI